MPSFTVADIARITALLLTAVLLLLANGLQGTLVPVGAEAAGFSDWWIAGLGSAYFIGFVAGCIVTPLLIRRVGHIRSFAILAGLTAATVLLHPIWIVPWFWALLRAAIGLFAAGLFVILESWLHHQASNSNRGRIFTTYATMNLLALTGGNYLFSLSDPESYQAYSLVAILSLFCMLPVALTLQSEPARHKPVRVRIAHLYRLSPVGFMGSVCVGLASGAFWTLGPSFAKARGLDYDGVALFMSAVILGGALAQWPMGRMSDFMDRRIVIAFATIGAIVAGLVLVASPQFGTFALTVTLTGAVLHGATAFPIGSLTNAHLNDHAARDEVTETASGILLVYGTAASFGPAFAAGVISYLGRDGLFYYSAAIHALFLVFVLYRMTQRSAQVHQPRPILVSQPAPRDERVARD